MISEAGQEVEVQDKTLVGGNWALGSAMMKGDLH